MNLPYMVTHRYFSDWFHASQSDALSGADFDKALADAWTKYQGDFLRRELKASWADIRMRAPEWADEKYGIAEDRVAERKERRRMAEKETRMREWAERAARGDFDDVSFDFGTLPVHTKSFFCIVLGEEILTMHALLQTRNWRASLGSSPTLPHRLLPPPPRKLAPTARRTAPMQLQQRQRRRRRSHRKPRLRSRRPC